MKIKTKKKLKRQKLKKHSIVKIKSLFKCFSNNKSYKDHDSFSDITARCGDHRDGNKAYMMAFDYAASYDEYNELSHLTDRR